MTNEKQSPTTVSRRTFMGTAAAAAGITIVPRHVLGGPGSRRRAIPSTSPSSVSRTAWGRRTC